MQPTQDNGQAAALAGMTELEERLMAPGGRHVRDSAVARLGQLMSDVEAVVAKGVAPAQYQAAQDLLKGLATARGLVATFPVGED